MSANARTQTPPPQAISTFELEARCPDIIEEVRRTRRPLLITRAGRPVAQLSPLARGRKTRGKKAAHTRRSDRDWAWLATPPEAGQTDDARKSAACQPNPRPCPQGQAPVSNRQKGTE